jgi:hypothetical protein
MKKVKMLHRDPSKKTVEMEIQKYELLRDTALRCLEGKQLTLKQLVAAISGDLRKRKLTIEGSLNWNFAWVSMDMEARKLLTVDRTKSPVLYSL